MICRQNPEPLRNNRYLEFRETYRFANTSESIAQIEKVNSLYNLLQRFLNLHQPFPFDSAIILLRIKKTKRLIFKLKLSKHKVFNRSFLGSKINQVQS